MRILQHSVGTGAAAIEQCSQPQISRVAPYGHAHRVRSIASHAAAIFMTAGLRTILSNESRRLVEQAGGGTHPGPNLLHGRCSASGFLKHPGTRSGQHPIQGMVRFECVSHRLRLHTCHSSRLGLSLQAGQRWNSFQRLFDNVSRQVEGFTDRNGNAGQDPGCKRQQPESQLVQQADVAAC